MLLTVTLTRPPATDLGYLLHKSPGRIHTRSLSFRPAHVFYPEASDERTHAEFAAWTARVAGRFGYAARHLPVGPEDPEVGPPTQLAVFSRG